MKMKKIMSIAAAAVLAAVCMTSCGSSSDDSAAKESGAEPAQAQQAAPEEQSASASDVAKKLFDGITYTDSLNTISADMIEKVYKVPATLYSDAAVYVGGVSTAEEIACFDAVDEAAATTIMEACKARIQAQITAVEGYNPDELTKLNDPVLVQKGNSVYMCLSNDNGAAKEIIG